MTGLLTSLALVGAAVAGRADAATPEQYRVELRVWKGDPLGSREEGTVKMLADAVLVTLSGRPGHFQSGGQVPVTGPDGRLKYEAVGTAVEVLPIGCPDGRVWVEVNVTDRELNPGLGIEVGGALVPGFTERAIRATRVGGPGERFRVRVGAASPTDQTWVEVTVRGHDPVGK